MHWVILSVASLVVLIGSVGVLAAAVRRAPTSPTRSSDPRPGGDGPGRVSRGRAVAVVLVTISAVVGGVAVWNPTAQAVGPATQVVVTAGDGQSATVGSPFTVPLSVSIEDSTNTPVPAATPITFTVPSSGASGTFVGGAPTVTDGGGQATTTFAANDIAGSYTVTVSSPGLTPATFSLTNIAGPEAQLGATGGSGQNVAVGSAATVALRATVEDAYGNVVTSPSATVTFTPPATGAGGAFAGPVPATATSASGVATAPAFTANTTTGPYTVTASSPGLAPATFSLTNVAGSTSKLALVAGDFQSAHIGTGFSSPLSVTAYDAYGHLVPGLAVTFTAPASGATGTFAGASTTFHGTTNASGVVTTPAFTANGIPGIYTVIASAGAATFQFALANYTIPGAPTIQAASAEDASAKVRWAPPASNGFGTITGYLITASDGAQLRVGNVSSAIFPGLVNGTSYSFTVAATNAAGTGPVSGVSNSVTPVNNGYWMVASDGGIFSFGTHPFYGSTGAIHLNRPIVGMAATPDGGGYWLVASDGGIFTFGDAHFFGSTGSLHLVAPIVGMAATSDGGGYWLVASDGGVFAFGDARFHGSTGGKHLAAPIVGMAATGVGAGYWLVASDGGVFAFGSAKFFGSTGAVHLNRPIVGMAPTSNSRGYLLVASDGGIFAFGDAAFYGSTGGLRLNRPIVGMEPTPTGHGYWLVASDGGVFSYGDALFAGSTGSLHLNQPIVGIGN